MGVYFRSVAEELIYTSEIVCRQSALYVPCVPNVMQIAMVNGVFVDPDL